jgi:hypothetical protein
MLWLYICDICDCMFEDYNSSYVLYNHLSVDSGHILW